MGELQRLIDAAEADSKAHREREEAEQRAECLARLRTRLAELFAQPINGVVYNVPIPEEADNDNYRVAITIEGIRFTLLSIPIDPDVAVAIIHKCPICDYETRLPIRDAYQLAAALKSNYCDNWRNHPRPPIPKKPTWVDRIRGN
jgi:hypothetical protein